MKTKYFKVLLTSFLLIFFVISIFTAPLIKTYQVAKIENSIVEPKYSRTTVSQEIDGYYVTYFFHHYPFSFSASVSNPNLGIVLNLQKKNFKTYISAIDADNQFCELSSNDDNLLSFSAQGCSFEKTDYDFLIELQKIYDWSNENKILSY